MQAAKNYSPHLNDPKLHSDATLGTSRNESGTAVVVAAAVFVANAAAVCFACASCAC
jgi:hypothetical protein